MGRGSRRLYHMSLHFFLSHFSPTLILARFGQAEDGAHSFFVITFLPYSSLLSAGQLPIVSFDELEDFFFTIDRDTERERAQGFFYVFALSRSEHVTISRGGLQNWDSFEFGLVRDGIPSQSRQSRLGFRAVVTSPRRFCLGYIRLRLDCVGWFNVLFIYLDVQ